MSDDMKEERIDNTEKAVNASLLRKERAAKTKRLIEEVGHPLHLFAEENKVLEEIIKEARAVIQSGAAYKKMLEKVRPLSIHYAKKGDLLYPLLKVRYEIAGPSDVLWTDDDEIRDEIAALTRIDVVDEAWIKRFETVIVRVEEMIYKEANILFPNCAYNFTKEEWIGIYHDQKDYAECFGVKQEIWKAAEASQRKSGAGAGDVDMAGDEMYKADDEIIMAGGHMTVEQLTALLNTIPLEITFVDADNINRFFNEGPKDFKRPQMAIDREVFSCHPPKVEEKVRKIIGEFRAGTLDEIPIWMEKNGKCMLVKYMAVRDKDKNYLGTLELVQDMNFAKEHFLPKKQGYAEEY